MNGDRQRTPGVVDFSRWRIPGGCAWVVIVLLLAVALYFLFANPADVQPAPAETSWPGILIPVFIALAFVACIWIWLRYKNRWLRVAQKPRLLLGAGRFAAAEQEYEKALEYARTLPPDDHRRGTMLFELATYLMK